MTKIYKPAFDKLYYIILLVTNAITVTALIVSVLSAPNTLFITLPILLFENYFFVSPIFGFVELRENTLYIKFGFFMKREIDYSKIRAIEVGRGIISDSMLSLKNALEHINIKYNSFDVVTVSIKDSNGFVQEMNRKISR